MEEERIIHASCNRKTGILKKTGFKMIVRRELNGRNCLQNKNYEGGLVQSSQAVFFLARIVERWEGKNGRREQVG